MVSVSSDIASALSLQSARAKSGRDEGSSVSDHFGSLVEQSSSPADTTPPPVARPDVPAPPRRDDRAAADRPKAADRREDRAAGSPQDRRTDAATDAPQTGKTARKDDKAEKSDQAADSKAVSADGQKDAASADSATDGSDSDASAQPVKVEIVPVAIPLSAQTGSDATAGTGTPETGGSAQPLAIAAAAALKAKLDAGNVPSPETAALPTDVPAEAEAKFAAMIAAATPGTTKGAKKTDGGETIKTAIPTDGAKPEGKTDASATAAPTDGPVAPKLATDAKTDQPAADAPKPDAIAAASTDAKPATEQTHAHRTEQAAQPASFDQTLQASTPQPQPTHLQATTNNAVAAQQLAPQVAVNPPVPLSGVAVEIAQSAKAGKTSFDIRLDPGELGRIDVRIEMDKHGNVTSHLTVEKPETLTMLRQDAPQLQRALEQAGFKANDSGLQFSLRDQSQQQQQQQSGDQSGRHMHRLTINDDDTVTMAPAARGYGRMYGANGGVDISI